MFTFSWPWFFWAGLAGKRLLPVTIEVSPDEKATAHVLFEEAPIESPELTQTITAEQGYGSALAFHLTIALLDRLPEELIQ